jgi:hypothetical protein
VLRDYNKVQVPEETLCKLQVVALSISSVDTSVYPISLIVITALRHWLAERHRSSTLHCCNNTLGAYTFTLLVTVHEQSGSGKESAGGTSPTDDTTPDHTDTVSILYST